MPLNKRSAGKRSKPVLRDVSFEHVRWTFLARLHGDEVRLAVLHEALGVADECPESAFVDLEMFAHRLRGAAAVFNFPDLRDAAQGVELAASFASAGHLRVGEPLVHVAVGILATRMASLNRMAHASRSDARD